MKFTKIKKIIALGLAATAAVSAMSMSVFAAESTNNSTTDSVMPEINQSVYDSDLEYIPEHKKMIEQYNQELKTTRATVTYSPWSWSNGMFSYATGSAAGIILPFYFTPTYNYLYFNVEVEGSTKVPYLTVNTYNNDGSLGYIGSYNITSVGSNSYAWDNKKRSLNAGTKYVFALLDQTSWSSASIDINRTSF